MKQKILKVLFDFNLKRAALLTVDCLLAMLLDSVVGLVYMSLGIAIVKIWVVLPWWTYSGMLLGLFLLSALVCLVKWAGSTKEHHIDAPAKESVP